MSELVRNGFPGPCGGPSLVSESALPGELGGSSTVG